MHAIGPRPSRRHERVAGWRVGVVRGVVVLLLLVGIAMGNMPFTVPRTAAADACIPETEPNDQPDTALSVTGPACLDGSLPEGDAQDTWVWTLGDDDASHSWTITLTGSAGTATGVELVPITSRSRRYPDRMDGTGTPVGQDRPGPADGDGAATRSFLPGSTSLA